MMSRIAPDAAAAERREAARYAESTQGRTYLGDAVRIIDVKPSPSGLESIVEHDDRVGTRHDARRIAPRSANRGDARDGRPGRRRGRDAEPDDDRMDAVRTARRLDEDLGSDEYF
jgi:hypothetical protein